MRFCDQKPSLSSYSKMNALREQDNDEIVSKQDKINQFFGLLWTTNKLWIAQTKDSMLHLSKYLHTHLC